MTDELYKSLEVPKGVESKFRFIILSSQRCEQLLQGGEVRVEAPTKKPAVIAMQEVLGGKVNYEILADEEEDAEA